MADVRLFGTDLFGDGVPEKSEEELDPLRRRLAVVYQGGALFSGLTVEENVVMGGAGSAVMECLHGAGSKTPLLQLGLPDRFVEHGDPAALLADCGLDRDGILASIRARLAA